jgi:hypothetical protein
LDKIRKVANKAANKLKMEGGLRLNLSALVLMQEYEQHEIGRCYPQLTETEKELLRGQLLAPGPKSKVILFDGKILDGWHQYLISKELGIECEFEEVTPEDPITFAIQRNEGRRQLTTTAKAKIVDKLAACKWGGGRGNQYTGGKSPTGSLPNLSTKLKVGATTVGKLRIVNRNKEADPEIAEAVDKEEITIDAGYEVQRLPKEKQAEALAVAKKKTGASHTGKREKKTPSPKRLEPVRPSGILRHPTVEETGFPVNGTMAEQDAHHRKYGRTPLYPKAIADMLKASEIVSGYVGAIQMASSDSHPSLEHFFSSVDAMLAWIPDRQKGEHWGTNFAGKAKKQLSILEERLPIFLGRLSKLEEILVQRKIVP